MLGFIIRLVSNYEKEHGFRPNLLYINHVHCQHLKDAFDEKFSFSRIAEMLQMEIILEPEATHPHVAWTQVGNRVASKHTVVINYCTIKKAYSPIIPDRLAPRALLTDVIGGDMDMFTGQR